MTKLLGEVKSQRLLKLYRERRYRELNSEIFNLSKKFPNDFFLHNLGGIVAAQTQLNDRAFTYFKRAMSIKPEASEPFVNVGYLNLKANKPKEALNEFLRAQSLDQKNVEAQIGRGLALQNLEQYPESLEVFRTIQKTAPDDPRICYHIGNTCQKMGQLDDAIVALKKSVELNANFFEAQNNLGHVFLDKGMYEDASVAFKNAIIIRPQSAGAHCNFGNALANIDTNEAINAYNTSLAIEPKDMNVHVNLISLLIEKNRLHDIFQAFRKAIKINPKSHEVLNALGEFFYQRKRYQAAIMLFEKALSSAPSSSMSYNNIGISMMQQGQISKAMAYFQQALKSDVNFAYAYANLGFIFQSQGDFTAAEKHFKQAVTKKTDYALAHRMAINLQRSKVNDLWIKQMLGTYQSANLKADDKAQICFALAVAYEKNSKFDLAAKYYKKANKHRYQALNYHFQDDLKKFTTIKEIAGKLSKIEYYPESYAPITPIFIIGMPRSGTTLIENIISAHSNVFPGGEIEHFFELADKVVSKSLVPEGSTLQRIRDSYFEYLKKIAPDSKFITDKLPHNFMHVWLIALALPEAKIIDISRSPAAVCWSNYTNYFPGSSHGYSCSLSTLIEYYGLYADLMETWREKFPQKIFSIKYENLVENLEQNAKDLISFLGLNWEEACLKPELNDRLVLTASSQQVRQTIYSGSSEKWKRFEPYLDKKFDIFSQSGK